jgi:hypothetical protein
VVFGYDGSELAKAAIAEVGRQLPAHRDAVVVTVWRTFNVEFVPEPGTRSDDHDASLIVLGSRGRAGLAGFLVGSAAGAVAAHSRRPVLIVHDHHTVDTAPRDPRLRPAHPMPSATNCPISIEDGPSLTLAPWRHTHSGAGTTGTAS